MFFHLCGAVSSPIIAQLLRIQSGLLVMGRVSTFGKTAGVESLFFKLYKLIQISLIFCLQKCVISSKMAYGRFPLLWALFSLLWQTWYFVILPQRANSDKLIWKISNNGSLSLKEAYLFLSTQNQHLHWAKSIWSKDIPPSIFVLTWRIMHNKVPTDDQLWLRGISFPSMCSYCKATFESSFSSILSMSCLNQYMEMVCYNFEYHFPILLSGWYLENLW